MFNINEIKKSGKKILKNNLWTLIILGLLMTIFVGEYTIGTDAFSNVEILNEIRKDREKGNTIEIFKKNDTSYFVNKYIDVGISQILSGNTATGIIKKYNQRNNINKGVFFSIFNTFIIGQTQLQNLINSVSDYSVKQRVKGVIVIIASLIGLLIKIMFTDPLIVSERRIYLESINYKKTKLKRLTFAFRRENYSNVIKTMLAMRIYKTLWNLTIIGGFIKFYSYKMVTFIIAENPNINYNDAIKMSRQMMNGNKKTMFKLDLSFIGWFILQYITFGIAGIYVVPYYTSTMAECYRKLRGEYKKQKLYNYELLNDDRLFEENDEDYYIKEKVKKSKLDYNKKYSLTSLILFFFIFSVGGWIWEVTLYLFRDGILVNRGTLYGPWLPIYGAGCTLIMFLSQKIKIIKKNPVIAFICIMILCTIIEYLTSLFIEKTSGVRYWDYTGVFLNINGRVCLECSLFFGIGGTLCTYIVAPYLEIQIAKIPENTKIIMCVLLILLLIYDNIYSNMFPHVGKGITTNAKITKNLEGEIYDINNRA